MNTKFIPLLVLAGATLLTACNEEKSTSPSTEAAAVTVAKEDAVAVVNGKYISKDSLTKLENEISQRNQGKSFPKEKLLEELIQRELLVQEAVQKQLDKTAEYTKQLDTVKSTLLTQAAVQNFLKSSPVTDADLEAEYNKNVAASGAEYKARHILVKAEDEAKQIITELSAGADFAELAKAKSTGPSGPQGGDLGWFAAGQMVAPFSEAVIALEDNKFTLEPVQTQFGYHVILREGSRSQTPPPFESIKEQIRPMLQRQKLQEFLTGLRTKAKVEILLEAPAPVVAPAPATPIAPAEETDAATKTVAETQATAKEIVTEATESAEQATSATVEATKNAVNKISETIETATEDAKSTVSDKVEQADKAVADKITNTVDALTK